MINGDGRRKAEEGETEAGRRLHFFFSFERFGAKLAAAASASAAAAAEIIKPI